jgi:WD40 repeat protein
MALLLAAMLLLADPDKPVAPPVGHTLTPVQQLLTIPLALAGGKTVECRVPYGPVIPVCAVAFSPDGRLLAVGGYQEVLLWDLTEARLAWRVGSGVVGDVVHALAWRRDGRQLAIAEGTPGQKGALRLLDVTTGRQVGVWDEPGDSLHTVAFSPDERLVATGGADGKVHVLSTADRRLVKSFAEHTGWVHTLAFSPDGKHLVSSSGDHTARVWQTEDWKLAIKLDQLDSVNGALFSPDSATVLVAVGGAKERAVRFRERAEGKVARSIDLGGTAPVGMVWDVKGERLFLPCTDKTVKAYGLGTANRNLSLTFTGHTDWVYSISVSPDGTRLASGSADGTVKLWNAADAKQLAVLVQLAPRTGHWLIATTPGFCTASLSAKPLLKWFPQGFEAATAAIEQAVLNPDQVKQVLAGQNPQPPALQ